MSLERYLNESLHERASPVERDFLAGPRGRQIHSLANDLFSGAPVNVRHVNFFSSLYQDFDTATKTRDMSRLDLVSYEGDHLAPGSEMRRRGWNISTETYRSGKVFYAMNEVNASVSDAGIFFSARSFPVKWYIDHINERCAQRGANLIDMHTPLFMRHNVLALAMLRVIEQDDHFDARMPQPFILPEKRGVLIGHTMRIPQGYEANRMFLLATNHLPAMNMGAYTRVPNFALSVRTYYGPDEMTPAMAKLRYSLLPFYQPQKILTLFPEMENFTHVALPPGHPFQPPPPEESAALPELAKLMKSPLWRQAARLPATMGPRPSPL